MTTRAANAIIPPTTPTNRRSSTSARPPQTDILDERDPFSALDDEEPPPYSRYDPLTHPQPEQPQLPLSTSANTGRLHPTPPTQSFPSSPQGPSHAYSSHAYHSTPHSMSTYPGHMNPPSPTVNSY